jgi:hypothetical protein
MAPAAAVVSHFRLDNLGLIFNLRVVGGGPGGSREQPLVDHFLVEGK